MEGERRKYPRLISPLEAHYRVATSERWESASTHDLSAGGIGLTVARRCEEVAAVERVRFRLTAEEPEIDLAGRTVYCGPDPDEEGHQLLGIEFVDAPRDLVERIRRFVFQQLLERGGAAVEGDAGGPERVEWAEPVQIRYERFTQFVDEATANLSLTGMFIQSDAPHPPGSLFEFRFQLNDDFPLIYGKAEVVWIRESSDQPDLPNGMGVRFVDLSDESRELIVRIVRQKAQDEAAEADSELDGKLAPDGAGESTAAARGASTPPVSSSASKVRSQLQRLRRKARRKDEEYKKQLEKAAQALAALRVRVGELEGENAALRDEQSSEQSSFADELRSVGEERDQLRERCDEERERSRELEATVEKLTHQCDEASAKESIATDEVAQLQRRIDEQQSARRDLEAETEQLKSRYEESEQKERAAAAERAAVEGRLTDERVRTAELEAELRATREKLVSAARSAPATIRSEEFTALEEHALELRQKVEELQRSLSASETARQQIKAANQEAYASERAARKEIRRFEAELEELRRERDAATAGQPEAAAEQPIETLVSTADTDRIAELEEEQTVLLQKLMVITRRADDLEIELERSESDRDRTDREHTAVNDAAAALDQQLREARRERDEIEQRLGREIEELRTSLAETAAAAAESAAQSGGPSGTSTALSEARQEIESLRQQLAAETSAKQREIEELQDSLSTSEAARRQIINRSNDTTAQEKLLRQQMAQLREHHERAEAAAEQNAANLREAAARLSAQEVELATAHAERNNLEEQLRVTRGELGETDRRASHWRLRAAALVAAGAVTGLLTGPLLFGDREPEASSRATTTAQTSVEAASTEPARQANRVTAGNTVDDTSAAPQAAAAQATAAATEPAATARSAAAPSLATSSPATPSPATPSPAAIEATIERWAAAWSEQKVSEYLSFYATSFTPPNAMTRGEWAAQRRNRIERPEWIRLSVAQLEPSIVDAGRGRAVFVQSYETPTYRDEVTKTLELVLEGATWKIVEEKSSS